MIAAAAFVMMPELVAAAASVGPSLSDAALCPLPTAGHMSCMSRVLLANGVRYRPQVGLRARPHVPQASGVSPALPGYAPADIQSAYNLSPTGGAGITVAVVDAWDDWSITTDLAYYRSYWGLPACTPASGCFTRLDEFGGTNYPGAPPVNQTGWITETALDLEAVSAACPMCHLMLIEAFSNAPGDLFNAVNAAVDGGANVISLSFGGPEASSEHLNDNVYSHPGVAVAAAAGDNGYSTSYPAASPDVVSVGGTTLTHSGSSWTETVWSGSGSGCSSYESKPSWQTDPGCPRRMLNDTAADADPSTGLAVRDVAGSGGWVVVGGTSLATPLVGSFLAQTGGEGGGTGASPIYQHWTVTDITAGSNGICSPPSSQAYFCQAQPGYDGPTGVGSLRLTSSVPVVGVSANTSTSQEGDNVTFTVTVSGSSGTPSGVVTVYDGNIAIGTTTLSSGSASVSTTGLSSGSHAIRASYAGDSIYQGLFASSTLAHTVVAQTYTAVTDTQPTLSNSDGSTWQLLDPTALTITFTPSQNESAAISANADLWTSTSGFNQDIGVCAVAAGSVPNPCPLSDLLTWKESGGFAGTFSPNAAEADGSVQLSAGTTYSFAMAWKTNHAGSSTIWAGAGPLGDGSYSPTRLVVRTIPIAGAIYDTHTTTQLTLPNSDGSTWQPMGISASLPGSNSWAIVSANADLWTSTSGFNQDIAIFVSIDGGGKQLLAWKESGGFAGTFSPNAALASVPYQLSASHSYLFSLWWKANGSDAGTIWAGAGPLSNGGYSPTRLVVQVLPSYAAITDSVTTTQAQLTGSDGSAWHALGTARTITVHAGTDALIIGNADLWTSAAGYNQDIGIFVSEDGGPYLLAAWKESGGYAGTYSPNAAALAVYGTFSGGHQYTVVLGWKSNRPDPGAIWAGAGPIGGSFSPTRFVIEQVTQ